MYHSVKLYNQSYNYGCWLASTHMLNVHKVYGSSYSSFLSMFTSSVYLDDWAKLGDPPHWVNYSSTWLGPNNGLNMDNYTLNAFAGSNDLTYLRIANPSAPAEIRQKIVNRPVMVAGDIVGVGVHFFVIHSFDTQTDTIGYLDPMPVYTGSRGKCTIKQFLIRHPGAFKHLFWKK